MSTRLLALFLAAVALPVQARVLLNEVHINPPSASDQTHQYLEILTVSDSNVPEAQTLGNLSVLFVDSNGITVGGITEHVNLNGLQTGANGLLLVGLNFDAAVPWTIAAETVTANFAAVRGAGGAGGAVDIGPKSGLTTLLVEGFTGANGNDLDTNNDGALDSRPWGTLLDSVAYGDNPYETTLTAGGAPDNISRSAANTTANAADAWYGGNLLDTAGLLSLTYDDPFGPFTGAATPGLPNQGPPSENPVRFNEVLVNPAGEDANNEFIELISTSGGITTTDGLWVLILDSNSDGGVVGEVLEAWNLSGQNTGINGLLVLGNNYTRSANPWKDVISKDTAIFEPDGMGDGDIGSNTGITLLLVKDFTGKANDVLGAGTDLDTNDDGILDARPWDQSGGTAGVIDSVGNGQISLEDASVIVRSTYALADVTPQAPDRFHPDSIFRAPGDFTPNSSAAWLGGNIGGDSSTGIAYRPNRFFGAFRGQVTPGLANLGETPVQSPIVINEVHLDPIPVPDANFEYIELLSATRTSTPLQDLSLLIVDVAGAAKGEIRNVLDLRGLTTGSNGLMLIGDSYNDLVPYVTTDRTHAEDPAGLTIGEIGPGNNESIAILLVEGFTGVAGTDIDSDNDGAFDAAPWTSIMDAVGFGAEFIQTTDIANLNSVGLIPDTISRLPSDLEPNSVSAWYGGTLVGAQPTSVTYGQSFGPFVGEATPGRFNTAASVQTSKLLINEVHINPPGNDDNFEYIEILSTSGGRQSTHNHTLVMVENSGGKGGEILEFWNLDGMATGTNGLLLLGNGYTPGTLAYWDRSLHGGLVTEVPFGDSINASVTAVGDPLDLGNDNVGPNDSFTLLFVKGFTGVVGQDLDVNDDGILDAAVATPLPWTVEGGSVNGVLDSLAILNYDDVAQVFDGLAYVTAQLGQQTFGPDNVSRKLENTNGNDLSAWFGGDIAGVATTGLSYGVEFFGQQAAATPGLLNGDQDTIMNEVNNSPTLSAIAGQSLEGETTLQLTASATDLDAPAQTLTFSLAPGAPAGASINSSSGAFTWTPSAAQVPGDYSVSIVVTDDGVPPLTDLNSFNISVSSIPEVAPVLGAIGAKSIDEGSALAFTASATDANQGQSLAYSLDDGAPEGASIDVSTGVFTWMPTEFQGPGTFDVIVRVTDDGNPPQSDAETVSVTVSEVNTSPTLTAIADQAIDIGSTLQFAVSASDRDEPAQTLAFSLGEGAPAGATIDPSSGVFSWSPTEEQTPGDYVASIVVTDDGDPALSDSQSITIILSAVSDSAPVLAEIGSKTIAEGTVLTFTASATDADQGQTLSYSLDEDAPSGAGIEPSTGVFSWTPTEAQGPGTFNLTIRVTDDGAPPHSDAEPIIVTVTETNVSPILANIGAKSIEEGATLEFTVGASDADEPAQSLTFSLADGSPVGASLSPEGAFSWTPTEEQGPGQFDVTVQVTDPGTPALIDSETLSITVSEANAPPVIAAIEEQSIIAGETLTVNVMADDSDVPTQNLTYRLVGTVPENASIDANTGVITWPVPELFEQRMQNLTVEVRDEGTPAQSATLQFSVGVSSIPAESANLTVTSVSFTDQETLTIHWDSESGKRYRLEFSDSLLPDQWASLGEIVADGLTASLADIPGDLVKERFYRIVRLD
jgi:hypothetical protein